MKNSRFYILFFGIVIVTVILIGRLFTLQILKYNFYKELAINQHQLHKTLLPERGEIFIKDRFYGSKESSQLFPLVINRDWFMVYAVPKDIEDKEGAVQSLSCLLEMDEEELKTKIYKKNDPYEPLQHKVASETADKINDLNITGIELTSEKWRYHSAGDFASHVLGFVGYSEDEKIGQYGIEGYYNKELGGEYGFLEGEKDTKGRLIAIARRYLQPAQDGADLILTIDPNIQFFVEEKLKEVGNYLEAEGGIIIVMNSKNGAIKALANWPSFDPNQYSEVEDINIFLNPAISHVFEPGSIFKPITMAIALDKKLLTSNTTYEDKGFVKVGVNTIRNSHEGMEGVQTMTQVLEKSLNTGAVFVQQLIDKNTFRDYLNKFGFSDKTGIDLEGEVAGNLSNLKSKRDIEFATASFGQGIAVTPIELVAALGAIANQGNLMKPYVVEKFVYSNGKEKIVKPEKVRQVISPEAASELTKMLVSVVDNGYGSKAGVKGYFIAGKTGTAQVPDLQTGTYSNKTIHSFGGFFPAFNPEFVVLVKIDNPKKINFAADSVGPVFGEIAKYILSYYEIPPTR